MVSLALAIPKAYGFEAGLVTAIGPAAYRDQMVAEAACVFRCESPGGASIRTLRDRSRAMGCFHNEPAIDRAVFGQLLRWHKIKLTHNT
jgi:hypothetical protein